MKKLLLLQIVFCSILLCSLFNHIKAQNSTIARNNLPWSLNGMITWTTGPGAVTVTPYKSIRRITKIFYSYNYKIEVKTTKGVLIQVITVDYHLPEDGKASFTINGIPSGISEVRLWPVVLNGLVPPYWDQTRFDSAYLTVNRGSVNPIIFHLYPDHLH